MSAKTIQKKTDKNDKSSTGGGLGNIIGLIVVAVLSAIAVWGIFGQSAPESTDRPIPAKRTPRQIPATPTAATPAPQATPSAAPTRQGQPWEYDPATNYHFDPRPGHQHWHQGQPPPENQRTDAATSPTISPVTTPITIDPSEGKPDRDGTPWEYDAETDFHWDPRVGHEHWHRGQPPAEDARQ